MITPPKEFWEVFKNTDGALSCTEAVAIMNLAAQVPCNSVCVELGTYMGKSAISAITQFGNNSSFTLVDPEFSSDYFWDDVSNTISKVYDKSKFFVIIKNAGYSVDVIPLFNKINYVFVDSGSHQDGLPMQEVKLLEDRMIQGGIIAFHDWDSQFVEVKQASDYLVSTGKYEYIPINWEEIIAYVNENDLEANNLSWHHQEMRNPNFVGAVKRK
jgi:predicted O-methyltransferase YrrM